VPWDNSPPSPSMGARLPPTHPTRGVHPTPRPMHALTLSGFFHSIIKVGKDLQDHLVQLQPIPTMPTSLSATSPRFLDTSRDGDSTTSLGSPSQSNTTLSEKKFFLTSDPILPWHNLKPLLLIPSLLSQRRDQPPPSGSEERSLRKPSLRSLKTSKPCLSLHEEAADVDGAFPSWDNWRAKLTSQDLGKEPNGSGAFPCMELPSMSGTAPQAALHSPAWHLAGTACSFCFILLWLSGKEINI